MKRRIWTQATRPRRKGKGTGNRPLPSGFPVRLVVFAILLAMFVYWLAGNKQGREAAREHMKRGESLPQCIKCVSLEEYIPGSVE